MKREWHGRRKAPYSGVSETKGRWQARIRDQRIRGGRSTYLGCFGDPKLAALAYDVALHLIGEQPANIAAEWFTRDHDPVTRAFIARIAVRIGR